MTKRQIFRILRVLLLIYAVTGIVIFYAQDYIILHPKTLPKEHQFNFSEPFKELNIPYTANSSINLVQFKTPDSLPKGVVLYFHGNRENINRYAGFAPYITRHGYEIWMIDYPGFGKSTGNFTEAAVYEWALTFYKLARARFSPDSIIIYGRSLGTGAATQLASIRDCRSVILETPYYSMPSVFDSYLPVYPFNKMIYLKFPNYEHLQKVDAPVTIFHGSDDGVIPIRNSKKLIPFLKANSEFVSIRDGHHNDLADFPEFVAKLDSILSR